MKTITMKVNAAGRAEADDLALGRVGEHKNCRLVVSLDAAFADGIDYFRMSFGGFETAELTPSDGILTYDVPAAATGSTVKSWQLTGYKAGEEGPELVRKSQMLIFTLEPSVAGDDLLYEQYGDSIESDILRAKAVLAEMEALDNRFVLQEDGKGLSANDYTDAEKEKVACSAYSGVLTDCHAFQGAGIYSVPYNAANFPLELYTDSSDPCTLIVSDNPKNSSTPYTLTLITPYGEMATKVCGEYAQGNWKKHSKSLDELLADKSVNGLRLTHNDYSDEEKGKVAALIEDSKKDFTLERENLYGGVEVSLNKDGSTQSYFFLNGKDGITVTAPDESGNPIDIGIVEPKYELIETVTVEAADLQEIVRTVPHLKRMVFKATVPKATANSIFMFQAYVENRQNESPFNSTSIGAGLSGAEKHYLQGKIFVDRGYWASEGANYVGDNGTSPNKTTTGYQYALTKDVDTYPYIGVVVFRSNTAGVYFPVGTVIEIWGVRA